MFMVRLAERRKARQVVKRRDVAMSVLLLIIPPALHVLHNAYHFNPFSQFLVVAGTMVALLVFIYQYDEEMIHRWLDQGLDMQVSLLHSVQKGCLANTNTGQYLMSVRRSFPPEVFFDIICFVQLHIQLSVAAKSRFMLREVQLDRPLEATQKETYRSHFTEYRLLEKRLGKTAMMTVAPVVRMNPADRKSLDDLFAEATNPSYTL
jgi:hypothetical protein